MHGKEVKHQRKGKRMNIESNDRQGQSGGFQLFHKGFSYCVAIPLPTSLKKPI